MRYRYFDYYRDGVFTCSACGWAGEYHELSVEEWAELIQGACPQCRMTLLAVAYPTADEVRAAAAAGHEEAVDMLEEEGDERVPFAPEFAEHHLERAGQLPDIPGEAIELTWVEVVEDEHRYAEIRHHAHVLWRERASFDRERRLAEVRAILGERYGPRLARFEVASLP